MAYYKKLRDLREDFDKTQSDIAEYLNTTAQYYGKYEKGEREIPFSRAIQLADYYDVSLDYIAERKQFGINRKMNSDEQELLVNWNALSERNRGKVEFLISELLKNQNRKT